MQREQDPTIMNELQVETILKTFEKKVKELYTLKPDTLLLEKEKYELLVRGEREKFKD